MVTILANVIYYDADGELFMSDDYLIIEATKKINSILQELEKECGSIVSSISLDDVDVTTMGSDGQQLLRSVSIKMEEIPSVRWAK